MNEQLTEWGNLDSGWIVIDRENHAVYHVKVDGVSVILTDRTTHQVVTFRASDRIDSDRYAVGRR